MPADSIVQKFVSKGTRTSTQMPLALIERLIFLSLRVCAMALDQFRRSGMALFAVQKHGRNLICPEINESCAGLARFRAEIKR